MSRKFARTLEMQCSGKKYYGVSRGTCRCQLEQDHDDDHVDSLGRNWQQRLPVRDKRILAAGAKETKR
jgi:hypothetical protein